MQSQLTNFPYQTKRNNKQQKKTTTLLTNQPIHTDRYLRYFKRCPRPPLVLPNVAHRID